MPDAPAQPVDTKATGETAGTGDNFNLSDFRRFIRPSNIMLFSTTGIFFVVLILICIMRRSDPSTWNMLLVASGALGVGGAMGFIYGSYGSDVSKRFDPVFTLVGGLLTGAAISDLAKNESGISNALNSLASACGQQDAGGLVVAIICSFASVGFLIMYVNLGLMLSPLAAKISWIASRPSVSILAMARELVTSVPFIDVDRRQLGWETDNTTTKAAELLANAPGAGETGSAEKLLADARAFAMLNKTDSVEKALRNALTLKPNDWRIEYELGMHFLFGVAGKEKEAIPYLESVVSRTESPTIAWKMLGFACLWDASNIHRSMEATKKYLELYPNDKEAQLWLQAARARSLSADNRDDRKALLDELGPLLRSDPVLMQRVRDEAEDGEDDDFRNWRAVPEFQELLGAHA
jgi:hypothetical protein